MRRPTGARRLLSAAEDCTFVWSDGRASGRSGSLSARRIKDGLLRNLLAMFGTVRRLVATDHADDGVRKLYSYTPHYPPP